MPLYEATNIPKRVRERFDKTLSLEADETLAFLSVDTWFRTGKSGLAFTTQRLVGYNHDHQKITPYSEVVYGRVVDRGGYLFILELRTRQAVDFEIPLFAKSQAAVKRLLRLIRSEADEALWTMQASAEAEQLQGGPLPTVEDSTVIPLCPHCDQELLEVGKRGVSTAEGIGLIYFCRHCYRALGVSHRQGYGLR